LKGKRPNTSSLKDGGKKDEAERIRAINRGLLSAEEEARARLFGGNLLNVT